MKIFPLFFVDIHVVTSIRSTDFSPIIASSAHSVFLVFRPFRE